MPFMIVAIPALITAGILYRTVRDPPRGTKELALQEKFVIIPSKLQTNRSVSSQLSMISMDNDMDMTVLDVTEISTAANRKKNSLYDSCENNNNLYHPCTSWG